MQQLAILHWKFFIKLFDPIKYPLKQKVFRALFPGVSDEIEAQRLKWYIQSCRNLVTQMSEYKFTDLVITAQLIIICTNTVENRMNAILIVFLMGTSSHARLCHIFTLNMKAKPNCWHSCPNIHLIMQHSYCFWRPLRLTKWSYWFSICCEEYQPGP